MSAERFDHALTRGPFADGGGQLGLNLRVAVKHQCRFAREVREEGRRRPDAISRNQGGSLDLHEDDGQLALREAGLLEEFFALARFEGQEMRQMDPAGSVHAHHVPDEGETARPEIDRGQLRDLLLCSLAAGTVQWGRTLDSASTRTGHHRRSG